MNYRFKQWWKVLLMVFAVNIALFTILYTNSLVKKLQHEERKNMQVWAEATKLIVQSPIYEGDDPEVESFLNQVNVFVGGIIQNNKNIPAMLVGQDGKILNHVNLDSAKVAREGYLESKLNEMKGGMEPIQIRIDQLTTNYIYYENSLLLSQLRIYPIYQLSLVALFLLVSYIAFSAARRTEQNRVWVGMAKETAHQLGTPISSLMAWIEMFRAEGDAMDQGLVNEMEKDVKRLELVADRFSKIGSEPMLEPENALALVNHTIDYFSKRSSRVKFHLEARCKECKALFNRQLMDWVIENLCKNAIDAMEGEGTITFELSETNKSLIIDIKDTGKGIPQGKFKEVFRPGYSTKKRGWGLGLSLAKRIVEGYHHGHIFVKDSVPGKGTTFRLVLRKN